MDPKSLMQLFLQIQNQTQIFHWQTNKYGAHKALDRFYNNFGDLVDSFIETYQGKYGRIYLGDDEGEDVKIDLFDYEGIDGIRENFIPPIRKILDQTNNMLDEENDGDLMNIRDEMLEELNTLDYLLTLE